MTKPRRAPKLHVCVFDGCGKAFNRRWNLTCHARIHNDDKPYVCHHDSCPRAFRWKSSLNHHLMSLDHATTEARATRRAAARARAAARSDAEAENFGLAQAQRREPQAPSPRLIGGYDVANLAQHPPALAPHPPPAPASAASLGVALARHRGPPRRLSGAAADAVRRRREADIAALCGTGQIVGDERGAEEAESDFSMVPQASAMSSASTVDGLPHVMDDALSDFLDDDRLPEWKMEDVVFKEEDVVENTHFRSATVSFPPFGNDSFFPDSVYMSESDDSPLESSVSPLVVSVSPLEIELGGFVPVPVTALGAQAGVDVALF